MYVVSATPSISDPIVVPEGLSYGLACSFAGCSGFYHPARGSIGVVLCSPWGFEDLTMRKSWRLLAEAIAKAGYPCIRFDYPGTGNSLGAMTGVAAVSDWVDAIGAAADVLRRDAGVTRFVFLGQSLGAALAVEAARGRSDVVGLQLIAPVVKGRAYVRELAATAVMVAERVGIALELGADEGLSVVGFALSRAMTDSVKALDLGKVDALAVPRATVYDQRDRKAGADAADHLRRLGTAVTLAAIEPYQLMVSDATAVQPLPVSPGRVIAALLVDHPLVDHSLVDHSLADHPLADTTLADTPPRARPPVALDGDGFREEPLRFGAAAALFGMLCSPRSPLPDAPAFILLNRGLNPHVGWRRCSVEHARGLAAAGFTSLRLDVAGLGESRDEAGRPFNLIYSDLLLPDIAAAVDVLAARGHRRIALAGVCSGAYMALNAAAADPRVTDVVAVNAQRIVWNPAETAEDVIRYGGRSVADYLGDVRSRHMLRKLVRSRRRIVPAMRFLAMSGLKSAMVRIPLRLRSLVLRNSMAARVTAFFTVLAERGTRVSLVFSEGDPGLVELRNYFGPRGRDLRFPNVAMGFIPDADHNLTATRASAAMLDHMIALAGTPPHRDDPPRTPRPAVEPRRAVCPT